MKKVNKIKIQIVDFDKFYSEPNPAETKKSSVPIIESIKNEHYGNSTLYNADCLEVLKEMPDNCIDSAVTDGPFAINFMNEKWDNFNAKDIEKATPRNDEYGISPYKVSGECNKSCVAGLRFQEFTFEWAKELLRVLKPGGYLLSFGSSTRYHRMVAGIEDAGFEIRDQVQWLFATGNPMSYDISRNIDKFKEIVCRPSRSI